MRTPMLNFPSRAVAGIALATVATLAAAPARADDAIRQANSVESLVLAISRVHDKYQSLDSSHAIVANEIAGPQLEAGWAGSRMLTFFGRPNFFTRTEVFLALSHLDYTGSSFDTSTGQPRASDGPFESAAEAMRMRGGYTWEFGPAGRFALTPFLALAQHAAVRGSSGIAGAGIYGDFSGEAGLMAQMSLTRRIVLGVEASTGHTLGAWNIDRHDVLGPTAVPSSLALYVDNRTFPNWHQRYIIRYGDTRFGGIESSIASLQPQRHTVISFQMEFGTEGNLFEELFRKDSTEP